VQDLTEQVSSLKTKRSNAAATDGRPVILQAVANIAARDGSSPTWTVQKANARIYNLQIRDTTDPWNLQKVTGDSVDRVVPLLNLWDVDIRQDTFVLAFSMGGYYVTAAPPFGLYRFTMNEGWQVGDFADCDILLMDGTDTGLDTDVYDPLQTFSLLDTGDAGYCILWGERYYAIQAPCPA
jgi:hypothetical protein